MIYLSSHINYHNTSLFVEEIEVKKIDVETPYYAYTRQGIINNYQKFASLMSDVSICYAVKANPNISIIKLLANEGAGVDVVSEGEMRRALIAGIKKIIFSGVGKTVREIEFALRNKVYQINVESISELMLVKKIANDLQIKAPISIRINLDIEGRTHDKISTCRKKDKFGISEEEFSRVISNDIIGLSIHIGSQISNFEVFNQAFHKLHNIVKNIKSIHRIDLGGGFSVPYNEGDKEFDCVQYCNLVQKLFSGYEIIVEPGRFLVANAGILVTKVLFVKRNKDHTHVIVDAGMNDLMRPALYGPSHEIIPLNYSKNVSQEIVDVVGPVCESSDAFVQQKKLPLFKEGDLVAVCTAGAYCASMSNNYNSRLLIPEIMVKGKEYTSIRRRESYEELMAKELDFYPDYTNHEIF